MAQEVSTVFLQYNHGWVFCNGKYLYDKCFGEEGKRQLKESKLVINMGSVLPFCREVQFFLNDLAE